jgi:hypothetical protein
MKAYNLLGDPSFNILGTGCVSNYTFTNNEVFTDGAEIIYHAANDIENDADFEIQSGADVTLLAGNSITLKPGFKAELGASFEARIEPCDNGSTLKSAKISDNVENENSTCAEIGSKEQIITPSLFSIFPNPTNSDFSVSYTLNEESFVKLELYDMSGTKIKTLLINGKQSAGNYYFNFSIPELAVGTCLFVFSNSSNTITSKIIKQ